MNLAGSIEMDEDLALRAAAITHVSGLARRHGALSWSLIEPGFEFRGENVRLATRARGIFKPARMKSAAALSIRSAEPRAGRDKRYNDEQLARTSDWFEYAFQDGGPEAPDNRLVRACIAPQLPVIYFYGVAPAVYEPVICLVVGEDRAKSAFHVTPLDPSAARENPVIRNSAVQIERKYSIVEVRRRLHQRRFSEAVMNAYNVRCAVCRLAHRPLLDAAHIVPDAEKLGEARVPNGLALCKLHHAAFDEFFIGVTPDYEVRVREDLLSEKDGPMLEHGIRGFHQQKLVLPTDPEDRPDPVLLETRWKQFAA